MMAKTIQLPITNEINLKTTRLSCAHRARILHTNSDRIQREKNKNKERIPQKHTNSHIHKCNWLNQLTQIGCDKMQPLMCIYISLPGE